MSENRVIGNGNKIPWHLPEDFKWFKEKTSGNIAVLGRKTFEGLPKPLPNRRKLILTRHPRRLIRNNSEVFGQYKEWRGGRHLKKPYQLYFTKIDGNRNEDIWIFKSLDMIQPDDFPNEIFICGGAQVYAEALPKCSDLYLTLVKRTVEGDTFFPSFEDAFEVADEIRDTPDFKIIHYRNRGLV